MKSHDQRHAPYVCQHEGCGKRYYSSNALTSHQRSHSYKEVDIKCSWPGCGKIFDKPCRLKAHMRSHTGYKPYPCTFQDCKWAFSSSSKLKRHQKKHTNERKFVCDVPDCGKAFMRSEHLKEHRLTHTEGRFFQCFVCAARFSAKSSLYVHIKKHQTKPDLNIASDMSECTSGNQKRTRTRESHCSRVKPIKPKRWNTELMNAAETIAEENIEKQDANVCSQDEDQIEWLYRCPIDICGHLINSETNLREHMLKAHSIHCDDLLTKPSSDDADIDYVLYTVHSSSPSSPTAVEEEQMVMVTPCDAVILNTSSPRTDHCLPEPPPFNTLLKSSETFQNDTRTERIDKNIVPMKEQGSARTDLTYSNWSKLKKNSPLMDSVMTETSDVVLGASDLSESLLFTEELPSMYYQDDVAGTEYQVLLLDSSPLESASNLRSLE